MVITRSTFASRLLVMLGCLGIAFTFTPDGAAAPEVSNAKCKTQACNKLAQATDPNYACPYSEAQNKWCLFDDAKNNLIWCDTDTVSCTLKSGTESNSCIGYCKLNPALACESTKYTVCVIP